MSPPRAEFFRRQLRRLTAVAAFTLGPKCFLCLAAYANLGALLGSGGPELCGVDPDSPSPGPETWVTAGATLMLVWLVTSGRWHSRKFPARNRTIEFKSAASARNT